MSNYISQSDIEDVFGKDNVAVWSNLDGETGAETARIARAIAIAEEDVENRFRGGKYLLPFSPIPEVVKNWCATLAGIWLFENRPGYKTTDEEWEGFTKLEEKVGDDIDAYTSGARQLDTGLASATGAEGPTVVL